MTDGLIWVVLVTVIAAVILLSIGMGNMMFAHNGAFTKKAKEDHPDAN